MYTAHGHYILGSGRRAEQEPYAEPCGGSTRCPSCMSAGTQWRDMYGYIPDEDIQSSEEPSEHDPVNYPSHYTSHPSGVECIDVTRHMGFNLGNAVKYLWRNGLKDSEPDIQDLEKAVWYIRDEIDQRKLTELIKEKVER